ncbi:SMI1/KNR4 family protein [Streptomyces erythrochromogenes]|uniref:SMI1/KNR4 family protein n=1 Tax=Streptomyces erythrochromogenes TaxID=285574 RepID=UPI00386542EA|nr:SMI1/KNR4 family protein [Streptomyces erythrochromogenes]WST98470.1 SMI1/KNR4 family protein [Streptomyces erythrochromogenes]
MELSRIGELIGSPSVLGDPEVDWVRVEARLGVTLPDDYKAFVSAYGSGEFMETLMLFHPRGRAGDEGLNLFDLWRSTSETYDYFSRSGSNVPPIPVYPDPFGAVPVGRSISGNVLFLVPPRNAGGAWSVAMDVGEWVFFEDGFTDFLWEALQGRVHPVLDGEIGFEQIGVLD